VVSDVFFFIRACGTTIRRLRYDTHDNGLQEQERSTTLLTRLSYYRLGKCVFPLEIGNDVMMISLYMEKIHQPAMVIYIY